MSPRLLPNALVAFFALATLLPADEAQVKQILSQAEAALAKQDYATAGSKFQEVLKLDPRHAKAHLGLSIAQFNSGKAGDAIATISQGIQIAPEDDWLIYNRASYYWATGDADKAIADFTESVRLNPDSPAAHNGLAWALATAPKAELRDGRRALTHATKSCELTQFKNPYSLSTLAAAHAELGEFDEALRRHNQATALPDYPKDKLGRANQRRKLYEQKMPYRELVPKPAESPRK